MGIEASFKRMDLPSSSSQEEDVFKILLKSKKTRSHIAPKRSIKKERFSAKRQLDPVAWSSYDEQIAFQIILRSKSFRWLHGYFTIV